MGADPGDALTALGRDGDLDDRRSPAKQPVQRTGAPMTQERARSAGEHGRHPAALAGERAPTDGKHAAVDGVQPSRAHHPADLVTREAEGDELAVLDRAMLRHRERSELLAPSRGMKSPAGRLNCPLDPHGPSLPGSSCHRTHASRRNSARNVREMPPGPSAPIHILNRP